ncbi:helix-turn-helix domain-containing protein [Nonomuraea angiospora]|uniref:Excisionase family DNA binding protein n=1 Tax=Nonomuraea angiospora TaxID=46172 RepID=A0ABR9LRZ6_9ACTN|nr:helix-turn-helix domain-containing protein [Nonomuraea angiospora]MBE1583412.1 excisionase family DNA binding protein [Nonomuraea angiospora]
MTTFRISEAATLLGVSSDTVRRWVDAGRPGAERDEHGHRQVNGADLAAFARSQIEGSGDGKAADELGLEAGVVAVAVIKSTNVVVEIPGHERVAGYL